MTMHLEQILPPPTPPPKRTAFEGALKDAEQLAIFLACGTKINPPPSNRVELLELWASKDEAVKEGYRTRARRLLRMWASP